MCPRERAIKFYVEQFRPDYPEYGVYVKFPNRGNVSGLLTVIEDKQAADEFTKFLNSLAEDYEAKQSFEALTDHEIEEKLLKLLLEQ